MRLRTLPTAFALLVCTTTWSTPSAAQVDGDTGSATAQDPAAATVPSSRASGVREAIERSFERLTWHRLENGLVVVLDPREGGSMVSVAIGVSVGRRDEPRGWTGLAHLCEHLMFRPRARAPVHYVQRLQDLGASEVNGMTEIDRTVFIETVPAEALARTLWLEAERFAHVPEDLDESAIVAEREIVLREHQLRDLWHRIAPGLALQALYRRGHPYADAHLERPEDLAAIDLSTARSFLQRAYTPERMTIAISGAFDPEEVLTQVGATLGTLRASVAPLETPAPRVPGLRGEQRLLIDVPRAHDRLTVIWSTPPYGSREDATLDVVARVLEERLTDQLRAQGLSVEVLQRSAELSSQLVISIDVPGRLGTAVPLEAVDDEIRYLARDLLGDAEVQSLRTRVQAELAGWLEGSLARASALVRRPPAFHAGRYDPRADAARYEEITALRVRDAVRRWLSLDRRLVISLNADPRAPYEGRLITPYGATPW